MGAQGPVGARLLGRVFNPQMNLGKTLNRELKENFINERLAENMHTVIQVRILWRIMLTICNVNMYFTFIIFNFTSFIHYKTW